VDLGRFGGGALVEPLRLVIFGVAVLGCQVRDIEAIQSPQLDRDVLIDRAGVRLLLADAQFGEPVQDLVSFHFQLPGQLVNPNLLHR
jgi:hypothetical protein